MSRRRLFTAGRRDSRAVVRSEIVELEEKGRESVRGRPRPGKEVMRTLIVCGAISFVCIRYGGGFRSRDGRYFESALEWSRCWSLVPRQKV